METTPKKRKRKKKRPTNQSDSQIDHIEEAKVEPAPQNPSQTPIDKSIFEGFGYSDQELDALITKHKGNLELILNIMIES